MREIVKRYFTDYEKALRNLKEGVEIAQTDIEIDGAIKRFELCYELVWKLIKEYLADVSIVCRSSHDTFREAHRNGIIKDNTFVEIRLFIHMKWKKLVKFLRESKKNTLLACRKYTRK